MKSVYAGYSLVFSGDKDNSKGFDFGVSDRVKQSQYQAR